VDCALSKYILQNLLINNKPLALFGKRSPLPCRVCVVVTEKAIAMVQAPRHNVAAAIIFYIFLMGMSC
jgi:hypothetical protein